MWWGPTLSCRFLLLCLFFWTQAWVSKCNEYAFTAEVEWHAITAKKAAGQWPVLNYVSDNYQLELRTQNSTSLARISIGSSTIRNRKVIIYAQISVEYILTTIGPVSIAVTPFTSHSGAACFESTQWYITSVDGTSLYTNRMYILLQENYKLYRWRKFSPF
jgi:hypothetical protein